MLQALQAYLRLHSLTIMLIANASTSPAQQAAR